MSRVTAISDVWEFLDAIPMFQKSGASAANFSLDNIRSFCEEFGDPQDQFPSIHVAGTNGKGTTCYLLEKFMLIQAIRQAYLLHPIYFATTNGYV